MTTAPVPRAGRLEPEQEARIVMRESGLDVERVSDIVAFGMRTRRLEGAGLGAGASTPMLVHAAALVMQGLSPRTACRLAMVEALSDDADVTEALQFALEASFAEPGQPVAIAGSAAAAASHDPLAQWLRLLWGRAPPLRFDGDSPRLRDGVLHLPARTQWRHHAAAAAHATAHLVYSPAAFDGRGLDPLVRALAGLLEDARVEALAMRELPGLVRLWRPLHTATPALGTDVEALIQRLARALADPGYDDDHPWVAQGRRVFFIDAGLGLSALRTSADVRRAAFLLGDDLGRRRLRFAAGDHAPAPSYRDDHRWMWPPRTPCGSG